MDVFIAPDSMTMEDYYAGFADAPAWISVSPQVGKLDRTPPSGRIAERHLRLGARRIRK